MTAYAGIVDVATQSSTAPNRTRMRLAGVLAAVVFTAGLFSIFLLPGGGEVTDAQFTDFYASGTARATAMILYLALAAGSLLMAWFYTELRHAVGPGAAADYAGRLAWLGSAATIIGASVALAPTAVQLNSGSDFVGIPLAHTFDQAGLLIIIVGGIYSYALATFLLCRHARHAKTAARWQATVGMTIAVLLLASYFATPAILLPAWVLFTALTYRPGSATVASGAQP